ncbi:hypothetical protein LOTGIDRAFT_229003 [Lottia gigantea]|uniref:MARVEL domain-containing protein n=1 Tax=Lottia gigantea TaxID=225164 RepID=V4A725_LOTGI|nr:hypothetical protein LOTGIDRAFT_229003 [Lottia gigantea]ESO89076.1 hypothetical protein LOTGIDRAFT_229003 [Lottia gigantea]
MPSDTTPILGDGAGGTTSSGPLYHDSSQSPRSKGIQVLFVATVIIMALVTTSLSIYRGIELGGYASLYFLMGSSLIGLMIILIIMIIFIRRDDVPKEKTWFVYLMGLFIILEAIFTNVLIFR